MIHKTTYIRESKNHWYTNSPGCAPYPPFWAWPIMQCVQNQVKRPQSTHDIVLYSDHVFGSKWLLNQLSKLGWSVGPEEVTRYKQNVVCGERIEDYLKGTFSDDVFHHHSADNADHNIATLDGKGTLHAMGILVSATSKGAKVQRLPPIARGKMRRVSDVISKKGVPIVPYILPAKSGLSSIFFKPMVELQSPHVMPKDIILDLMWHAARFLKIQYRVGQGICQKCPLVTIPVRPIRICFP